MSSTDNFEEYTKYSNNLETNFSYYSYSDFHRTIINEINNIKLNSGTIYPVEWLNNSLLLLEKQIKFFYLHNKDQIIYMTTELINNYKNNNRSTRFLNKIIKINKEIEFFYNSEWTIFDIFTKLNSSHYLK